MRASRCWQHGHQPDYSINGNRYWKTIRSQLTWGSPERVLERAICREFVKTGDRTVNIPCSRLPNSVLSVLHDTTFQKKVRRLVDEAMYGIRIAYRQGDSCLVVVAV